MPSAFLFGFCCIFLTYIWSVAATTALTAEAGKMVSGYFPAICFSCCSIIFFTIYPPTDPFCLDVRSPLYPSVNWYSQLCCYLVLELVECLFASGAAGLVRGRPCPCPFPSLFPAGLKSRFFVLWYGKKDDRPVSVCTMLLPVIIHHWFRSPLLRC